MNGPHKNNMPLDDKLPDCGAGDIAPAGFPSRPTIMKLDLKISYICNNRCRFCVQGDKRFRTKNWSTDELKGFIVENSQEYKGIVFTGGEPTIHKDFLELVSTASGAGYTTIQIQTNGRMFASKSFCRDTISAGATEIAPALHGHRYELHDYLTRAPGSFRQTVTGILNIRSMGLSVITNTVVTKSNFRHLPQIAKFLISLDVKQYQFAFVHPAGEARQNYYSVVPRKSMAISYIHAGLAIGMERDIPCYTEAVPFCFMRGFERQVAENIIPESKIMEIARIVESYSTARKTHGKMKGPQCEKCFYFKTCEGPWREYPEHYGWDEFHPVPVSIYTRTKEN